MATRESKIALPRAGLTRSNLVQPTPSKIPAFGANKAANTRLQTPAPRSRPYRAQQFPTTAPKATVKAVQYASARSLESSKTSKILPKGRLSPPSVTAALIPPMPESVSSTTSTSTSTRSSMYNGAQVAEPCVADALTHVLEACGHKVITNLPEQCGRNCRIPDSLFANPRTQETFACPVCIDKSVREHDVAKRVVFVGNLERLEQTTGAFNPSWRAERIARMERIWQNDSEEEREALGKSGRRCQAIYREPIEVDGVAEVLSKASLDVAPLSTDIIEKAVVQKLSSPSVTPIAKVEKKAPGVSKLPMKKSRYGASALR